MDAALAQNALERPLECPAGVAGGSKAEPIGPLTNAEIDALVYGQ
jgi:hypothetical protein